MLYRKRLLQFQPVLDSQRRIVEIRKANMLLVFSSFRSPLYLIHWSREEQWKGYPKRAFKKKQRIHTENKYEFHHLLVTRIIIP